MAAPKGREKGQKRRQADTGQAGVEPGVRTFTTWTPALLRSAEIQAENGNLRAAASLTDWILSDDRVQGALHTRVQALLGLDPTFEQSGDKRRSRRVVNALEAKEDWWASYPEQELWLMLAWGILLGVVPLRHGWLQAEGHGGRVLPCPAFWHPQHLRSDGLTREWKIRVQLGPQGGTVEQVLTPGDGEWILHTPYGANRPQMLGLWRGLARWVLLKYLAMSDWANASAKGSTLTATNEGASGTSSEGRNAERHRDQLARDIYERGKDGVVVLPPGFDLKLIQTAANSETIYRSQIELANSAIAVAARGGNLTTEVKEGSRAAIEVQERLGDQAKLQFDGQSLTTTIHDQSLNWWALFNFGDAALAPWPIYPTAPKRDLGNRAKAIVSATDAAEGILSLGLQIEQQAFIDEWELSAWVKPGGQLLERPAPNPAGPPPGEDPAPDPEKTEDDKPAN